MEVFFDKSFSKKLDKFKNEKILLSKIEATILNCENSNLLSEILPLKKMKGFKNYYRIKIGTYRIGIEIENKTITFITIAHRKDIYNEFP